jgi:hypothetical protein
MADPDESEDGERKNTVSYSDISTIFPQPKDQDGPWMVAMVINTSENKNRKNNLMIAETNSGLLGYLNRRRPLYTSRSTGKKRDPLLVKDDGSLFNPLVSEEGEKILEETRNSGYWANVISVAGFREWNMVVVFLFLWYNRTRGVNSRFSQVFGLKNKFMDSHKLVLYYYNHTMMEHVIRASKEMSRWNSVEDKEKQFNMVRINSLIEIIMRGDVTLGSFTLFNDARKNRPKKKTTSKRRRYSRASEIE